MIWLISKKWGCGSDCEEEEPDRCCRICHTWSGWWCWSCQLTGLLRTPACTLPRLTLVPFFCFLERRKVEYGVRENLIGFWFWFWFDLRDEMRERELWFRPMYWTEFCPSCYRESFACLNKVRFKQSGLWGGYGSGWIRIGCGSSHMMVLWLLSIFYIAKCEKELFANCFNQHHRMLIYLSLDSVFIYLNLDFFGV